MDANGTDEGAYLHEITEPQLVVIKTFTIVASLLGTVGNSLTIFAIFRGKLYTNASFLFILNLSICNWLHCILFHPLLTVQAFHGIWTDSTAWCNVYSYGLFSLMGTELFGYVCITINRYVCVVHHHIYPRIYKDNRIIAIELAFSWLFYPVLFIFPLTTVWGEFQYAPQKLVCHPFNEYDCNGLCLFVYIFAIVSTAPLIIFCYSSIIYTYIKSQKKVGLQRETSRNKSLNSEISNKVKNDSERQRSLSELRMAFTILAVTMVFGCCRLPFMVLYLYDPSMSKVDPFIHTLLIYFGANSDWVNPIIYAFTNKQISNSLIKTFHSWQKVLIIQNHITK